MKRKYILHAEPGQFKITGSSTRGILGATYTGRSIDVEGGYAEAKKWLENYEASQEKNPELEQKLLENLVPVAGAIYNETLFRGLFFITSPKSAEDFGPPPLHLAKRGRYNREGVQVLYLCSSAKGVMRELGMPLAGQKLWIQRFRLLPHMQLADARELPMDSLAAAVFWLIESGRDRASQPPHLGERVGQILSVKYDGLIVPGVRGEPNELYHNVVIFHPRDRWIELLDSNAYPEEAP